MLTNTLTRTAGDHTAAFVVVPSDACPQSAVKPPASARTMTAWTTIARRLCGIGTESVVHPTATAGRARGAGTESAVRPTATAGRNRDAGTGMSLVVFGRDRRPPGVSL
jgi:hypothetical protein